MPGQGSGAGLTEQGLTGVLQGAGWVVGFRLVFVFFEAEVNGYGNGNGNGNGNGYKPGVRVPKGLGGGGRVAGHAASTSL